MNKKVLFLYSQVQPFLLAGIDRLIRNYDAEVLAVCWPRPEMAPIDIKSNEHLRYIYKENDNNEQIEKLVEEFDPHIVYTSGWMDKDYLKICRRLKKAGKITVMGMDTQWKGFPRQRLHSVMSPFTLRPVFSYAWVPGPIQYEYARRLGFDEKHILNHLYAPDTDLFKKAYEQCRSLKEAYFPKAFLYVGRLVPHKFGPLLTAFSALTENERAGWTLIVVGKGPMEQDERMSSNAIIYKGFLQQDKLAEVIAESGVFCLLSTEEPWGTVIQEFAAAGMPVLASKQCGASHVYVKEGQNGLVCDGENPGEIKAALLKVINMDTGELLRMGERSMQMASPDNSDLWAKTLMSVA